MTRVLSWIVMVPFAIAVVVFSAVNTGLVTLDLWPLPIQLDLPIFTLVLAVFVVGFLWGGLVAWLSAGKARMNARRATSKAEQAERELQYAKVKIERLEADAKAAAETKTNLPATAGTH